MTLTLEKFIAVFGADHGDSAEDASGRISLKTGRIWQMMTGWKFDEDATMERWNSLLNWPPDVFAICAAVLKRSGCYSAALEVCHNLDREAAKLARGWLAALENCQLSEEVSLLEDVPTGLRQGWDNLWKIRHAPLSRIVECEPLMALLIRTAAAADRICEGSGLPIHRKKLSHAEYRIIAHGWKLLEPTRYGSSLCSRRIHPNAARVLPKMHVPQSGLTLRSLSHNLAFCESDEIQPRWFMIPGARGDVTNRHHINLLILPWPVVIDPAQFKKASRRGSGKSCFFDYSGHPSAGIAAKMGAYCDEATRLLGSLDGVVLPELALTASEFNAVRGAVLARKLLLVSGVGSGPTPAKRATNRVCIDVPLSKHHAAHFRQSKHHRWKLDRSQIVNYGIGAQLNPERSYWENIDVGDRRLLFLVLRPWLVTSILICEDLARHDPVGDLLRGVGPHLVIALLMDGPQLVSRWPSRYATVLADDPGSSVISVSSLGMVGLSRPHHSRDPNRTAALWKDSKEGAKELSVPPNHQGLAVTISVEFFDEDSPDGRKVEAARPVLTGVHPIHVDTKQIPGEIALPPEVEFLAPHQAANLARLVQQLGQPDCSPELLAGLTGEALAIGKEVWRLMTDFPSRKDVATARRTPRQYAPLPDARHTDTAEEICQWHATNLDLEGVVPDMAKMFPGWAKRV